MHNNHNNIASRGAPLTKWSASCSRLVVLHILIAHASIYLHCSWCLFADLPPNALRGSQWHSLVFALCDAWCSQSRLCTVFGDGARRLSLLVGARVGFALLKEYARNLTLWNCFGQ